MDLEDGPGPGQGRQQRGRPGEHGTSLERASDGPRRRRTRCSSTSTCRHCGRRTRGWTTPRRRRCWRTAGRRRVPGCPDWPLADLVRHVAEVQHLWAWVVRTRADRSVRLPEPPTHPDDELLGWLDAQHAELEAALAGADPAERVWTWAPQQDVAFVLRRQAAGGRGAHRRRRAGARRRPPDPDRRRAGRARRVAGGDGARRRCRTGRRRARTRWSSTPWTPTPSGRSSPARRPFPIAALTGHGRRPAAGRLAAGARSRCSPWTATASRPRR